MIFETPEFQRQTRDFFAAVQKTGKPVKLMVGKGYNHFELLETISNPYWITGRAILQQMKLAASDDSLGLSDHGSRW
jgi:arylformamidase